MKKKVQPATPVKRWVQCMAGWSTHRGSGAVFCSREEGHEGDHRGIRVQWNQKGEKVPITMKDST